MNNFNNSLRVSVIIPTYKRSNFLIEAINSVLLQSYSNIEIIVVDDNDPNSEWRQQTKQKMQKYSSESRVKYICHEKNKNGSAARNTGIMCSTGDYLCFLDDDDFYYPDKIEKQINFIKDNNIDACFCDYKKNGKLVELDENCEIAKNILLSRLTPQTSGWMMSAKAVKKIKGFDESYFRNQDYEFLLRFLRAGFSIKKLDEVLYERNITDINNRVSGEKIEFIKKKLFSDFSDFIDFYKKRDKNFEKELYVSAYLEAFKAYFNSKDLKNCFKVFFKSCKISFPITIIYYYKIIKSHF